MQRRTFLVGLCLSAASLSLPSTAHSQVHVNLRLAKLASEEPVKTNTLAFYSDVTLDANGDGTQVFEHTLEVVSDSEPSYGSGWYYDWPSKVYRDVRAWDANGPLRVEILITDGVLEVIIYFRQKVEAGRRYTYWVTATVGSIGEKRQDGSWRAFWYVHAGQIPSFRHTMAMPINATIDRAEPGWTRRAGNRVTWAYENHDNVDGFNFTVYVYYRTSTASTAPIYLQRDATWASDAYGRYDPVKNSDDNIRRWGCAMCCAAMIISAYAERQETAVTNPKVLNNYLRSNNFQGYDPGNLVIWSTVAAFAAGKGVPLRWYSFPGGTHDQAFDAALASGDLIIAGVNNGGFGHFVVITGKTVVNGKTTYTINDPIHGKTTLLAQYGDATTSLRFFTVRPVNQANLVISAYSPVEFVVTDPNGRRSGLDPRSGQSLTEIPDAIYETIALGPSDGAETESRSIEVRQMVIPVPEDGPFTTEVIGTGEGDYTLQLVASNWQGDVTKSTVEGITTVDQVDSIPAVYRQVAGVEGPGPRIYLPIIQG